ncbi:MAG: mechanosensitive ion channel family protein [Candidatus Methanosuratincola sp.]|jgi:small conductance mechanosensitive channel
MTEVLSNLVEWLLTSGLRILGVIVGSYVVVRLISILIGRLEKLGLVEGEEVSIDRIEAKKRLHTIGELLKKTAIAVVLVIAAIIILAEFGVNVTPIIASAGIVGLAVGFGAQNLVRDIISGLFLILENQVRVGDFAEINGQGGLVEAINLRTVVLRDLEGTVHIFPNGTINALSNKSKEWSRVVLDVGVAYKEKVDNVMDVLRKIGAEMTQDERYGGMILEPLEVLGVDDFGSSDVKIRCLIKTIPLKQWEVGREFRRRIKNRFDELGIEIPFPHISLYVGENTKPLPIGIPKEQREELRPLIELSESIMREAERRGKGVDELVRALVDKVYESDGGKEA